MADEEKHEENEQPSEPEKKVDEEWKKQAQTEKEQTEEQEGDSSLPPLPPVSFAVFVNSLAVQALIALGEIDNPITKKKERDLDQAKYTIDTLGMLEEKTKGNLTPEEEKLLNQILYDVRMRYVAAAGS